MSNCAVERPSPMWRRIRHQACDEMNKAVEVCRSDSSEIRRQRQYTKVEVASARRSTGNIAVCSTMLVTLLMAMNWKEVVDTLRSLRNEPQE